MAEFLAVGTEYDIELTKEDVPCQVKIGGKTEKFVPNINMQKWGDECWLNINHPDVVGLETESVKDDKIELVIGDNTHRYYEKEGKLEYEIELKKKPSSNTITLDLNFPDGLNFYHQPELTQQEIDAGDIRPDNVINSYAVYWKKKNHILGQQNYKTGKFCHIYRPEIIDSIGNKIWAELKYQNKQLIITIPQDWLDNAIYPIVIDPTFGTESQGGSSGSDAPLQASGDDTPAGAGTLNTIHLYQFNEFGAGDDVKVGLYKDNAGLPGAQEGSESETQDIGTEVAALWGVYNCNIPITAIKYWFGWIWNGTVQSYYDASPGTERWHGQTHTYANAWPDPMVRDDFRERVYSVFGTYTAAAAGGGVARIGVFGNALVGPFGGVIN